ncbi:hypothetical protein [Acinetobacter bereziniae]|nr:hypothetical protein [Acinetobacter bereziniae]
MLLVSIVLMSHFYTELAFFEQNDWIRLGLSILIILMILLVFWWINAFIVRQVVLKQQYAVTAVFKQKISYIMRHPLQFKSLYITTEYLSISVWMNRFLSALAFILLFIDIHILFSP